jgi:hypothetical protein
MILCMELAAVVVLTGVLMAERTFGTRLNDDRGQQVQAGVMCSGSQQSLSVTKAGEVHAAADGK